MSLLLSPLAQSWRRLVPGRTRRVPDLDWDLARETREHATTLRDLSEDALRLRASEVRDEILRVGVQREVAVQGMALVFEAVRRVHGLTLYDVQLLAGWVLCQGGIAQLDTGEGKTLVAAVPAALHALTGRGVHVATTNAYLAERDFEHLRPVFEVLGLTTGLSRSDSTPDEKWSAYRCDITYSTGYELGFDFLREEVDKRQRAARPLGSHCLDVLRGSSSLPARNAQRPPYFAVLDEVDSVLIDEALTPLVIAGPANHAAADSASQAAAFQQADQVAGAMRPLVHFRLADWGGGCEWTAEGERMVEETRPRRDAARVARPWKRYLEQALRARHQLQRDAQYVVADGRVLFVDEFTGRVFAERQWQDGLHQAIEAKEGVEITAERVNQATITRQRFFRRYPKLCGMTGTAVGHEAEFASVYRLPVAVIPPHKPSRRVELPPRYFATNQDRVAAIIADCAPRVAHGQPVLIGTRTIGRSEEIAAALRNADLPFALLNGKQDADEAALIAEAGQSGRITVATNMAGRGTDIRLAEQVRQAAGLHVIGVERHGARRIDRQLAGRAGRQGDPGSCQFFVSAEDELLARFAPQLADRLRRRADEQGECHFECSLDVSRAQILCENHDAEARNQLLHRDDWLQETLRKAQ